MSPSSDVAIPQAMQQHGGRNHQPPKPTQKPEGSQVATPANESEGTAALAAGGRMPDPAPPVVP
jgi:hypothetical protein